MTAIASSITLACVVIAGSIILTCVHGADDCVAHYDTRRSANEAQLEVVFPRPDSRFPCPDVAEPSNCTAGVGTTAFFKLGARIQGNEVGICNEGDRLELLTNSGAEFSRVVQDGDVMVIDCHDLLNVGLYNKYTSTALFDTGTDNVHTLRCVDPTGADDCVAHYDTRRSIDNVEKGGFVNAPFKCPVVAGPSSCTVKPADIEKFKLAGKLDNTHKEVGFCNVGDKLQVITDKNSYSLVAEKDDYITIGCEEYLAVTVTYDGYKEKLNTNEENVHTILCINVRCVAHFDTRRSANEAQLEFDIPGPRFPCPDVAEPSKCTANVGAIAYFKLGARIQENEVGICNVGDRLEVLTNSGAEFSPVVQDGDVMVIGCEDLLTVSAYNESSLLFDTGTDNVHTLRCVDPTE